MNSSGCAGAKRSCRNWARNSASIRPPRACLRFQGSSSPCSRKIRARISRDVARELVRVARLGQRAGGRSPRPCGRAPDRPPPRGRGSAPGAPRSGRPSADSARSWRASRRPGRGCPTAAGACRSRRAAPRRSARSARGSGAGRAARTRSPRAAAGRRRSARSSSAVEDEDQVEVGADRQLARAELAEPEHDEGAARHAAMLGARARRSPAAAATRIAISARSVRRSAAAAPSIRPSSTCRPIWNCRACAQWRVASSSSWTSRERASRALELGRERCGVRAPARRSRAPASPRTG